MQKANLDIRERAEKSGIALWQIANAMGYADYTFSKKLRFELSDDEKKEVYKVIERLEAEK